MSQVVAVGTDTQAQATYFKSVLCFCVKTQQTKLLLLLLLLLLMLLLLLLLLLNVQTMLVCSALHVGRCWTESEVNVG
jgi:hypothetical protein